MAPWHEAAQDVAYEAFQANAQRLRQAEQLKVDHQGDFETPNAWLRQLDAATHLKGFSGEKDFLRDLLAVNPHGEDDQPVGFIYQAIDECVHRGTYILLGVEGAGSLSSSRVHRPRHARVDHDQEFHGFVELRRVTARLGRLVVDEGHTVLEGSPRFRPKLHDLGALALFGVLMAYLIATLPPFREDELFSLLHTSRQAATIIRARTTRANVRYSVEHEGGKYGKGEPINPRLQTLAREKLRRYYRRPR